MKLKKSKKTFEKALSLCKYEDEKLEIKDELIKLKQRRAYFKKQYRNHMIDYQENVFPNQATFYEFIRIVIMIKWKNFSVQVLMRRRRVI